MNRGMLAIVAFGLLLVVAGPASADLVVNGNFDANSPPAQTAPAGWTLTPAASGSDFFVGAGPGFGAFSPPNSANFGAVGSLDDTLSQTLATTPGVTYTLTYQLAHDGTAGDGNDFSASFGGVVIPGSVLVDAAGFGYTLFSFTVTASTASTVLSFAGREVPAWYDLDNVSVVGVPEPSSLALSGLGMVGAGFFAVRKRRAARRVAMEG
jgi:hypothetical protein